MFCGLTKGISPKMCILCVCVITNNRSFEPFMSLDLLQGQLSVLTRISLSVPPLCYRSSPWKIPDFLPNMQVAGYSWTRIHPSYVALHEVTCHGAWLYGVHRTRRDGSSFTWHQPCKNQTALHVHHFGWYSKRAITISDSHSFRIACEKSSVSLLESGE